MARGGDWLSFLNYETVAIVDIKNWHLGALFRGIQLIILFYVIGFSLFWRKAYQVTDTAVGSADIKVKGTAFVNSSGYSDYDPTADSFVLDAIDLVVPSTERDAVFITTNRLISSHSPQFLHSKRLTSTHFSAFGNRILIEWVFCDCVRECVLSVWVTRNQSRGRCYWIDSSNCCPCRRGKQVSSGIQTGNCTTNVTIPTSFPSPFKLLSTVDPHPPRTSLSNEGSSPASLASVRFEWDNNEALSASPPAGSCPIIPGHNQSFCEVSSWCPTEYEPNPNHLTFPLEGVENFTVFIRINVFFSAFNVTLDNTAGANSPVNGVNLWTVREIVEGSGYFYDEIYAVGAIIVLNADWNCDLDQPASSCSPSITFNRIDNTKAFSTGYNFRQAQDYSTNLRDVYKRYGLRVMVIVSGQAGKFALVPLFTALGAGLGLLSVATLVADFIAINLLGKRSEYYKKYKIKQVGDDQNNGNEEEENGNVSDDNDLSIETDESRAETGISEEEEIIDEERVAAVETDTQKRKRRKNKERIQREKQVEGKRGSVQDEEKRNRMTGKRTRGFGGQSNSRFWGASASPPASVSTQGNENGNESGMPIGGGSSSNNNTAQRALLSDYGNPIATATSTSPASMSRL